ncbi:MAG: GNAT family N-acetyltransferase [Burkholderiales bacterium]|nr:GNAT family N-acetyltransferase [Burkholderiales bacterium]
MSELTTVARKPAPLPDEGAVSTRSFVFPLSVYARVLELQSGRVDYMHYGVFESPEDNVRVAQERASALMWQALPPPPGRILEVGIGLGTTLARLKAAGYAPFGITPDAQQAAFARQRHGQDLPLDVVRLEDFAGHQGPWQTLLFQESAQYIDPLAIFDAAHRLLGEGPATLVVMDEFALKRESDEHRGLHRLDHFCALAARWGWRLTLRTELSRKAQPSLSYMQRNMRTWAEQLRTELQLAPGQLAELDAALQQYWQRYEEGLYGYALLRFERAQRPAERLVAVEQGHAAQAQALFAQVFGHTMSPAHWHWKYGEGRGRAIGLLREGVMVAHYGGVTRRVSCFGQPALACQVCDVMVAPGANTALQRRGPVYQVGATFLEREIGWGQPHRVGFGFPSQRAFGVAQRQGLYEAVDSIVRVSWPAADTRAPRRRVERLGAPDAQGQATLTPRQRQEIDGLWQAMAAAFPHLVLGVRDAAWVQHRYLSHPTLHYQVLLLRRPWTRRPVGLLVMRLHEQHLELLDLVGPPEAFAELVAQARREAQAAGLARVEAWITQSQQACLSSIDPAACSVVPLGITVPANVHTPGPVEELRDRWFLLGGDADFT